MKRLYRLPLWILIGLAVLLLVLHAALPTLVLKYLNRQMASMGDYTGHAEDVDLTWWRGSFRIEGITVQKKGDSVQVPLFESEAVDTSISWGALLRDRSLVAEVTMTRPHVNFVDGGDKGESQRGEGVDWRAKLEDMMNMTLEKAHVVDGQVSFRNFTADPPVHVYANAVQLTLYNLTNTADAEGRRVAELDATGKLFNHAPLELSASFDPFTEWKDFALQLRVTDVDLTQLNAFSQAYGRFDFNQGKGDLVVEAEATNGQLDGYIKPLLTDVDVFNLKQDVTDDDKGFFQAAWEAVVGGTQEVLENQRRDQFATRIELSGNLQDTEVSPLQAFLAILRNAFVQAFTPRFERALGGSDEG